MGRKFFLFLYNKMADENWFYLSLQKINVCIIILRIS